MDLLAGRSNLEVLTPNFSTGPALVGSSREEDPYAFNIDLPSAYDIMVQHMLWRSFLDKMGHHLGFRHVRINDQGTELRVGRETVIEGHGGVKEGRYVFHVTESHIPYEALIKTIDDAAREMNTHRPGILDRLCEEL